MKTNFLFLIQLIFLSACSEGMQKKYYRLEELRVLAVIADSPEVNTVSAVSITPVISYPDGGNTILDISYQACLDPGITYGEDLDCDSAIEETKLSGSYTYDTANLGVNNAYTGQITPFTLTIPAANFVLLNALSAKAAFNGLDYLVYITITDQNNSSSSLEIIKRIKLSSKTADLNTNPTISGTIQANGVDLTAFPGSKVDLTMSGLSAAESYQLEADVGLETLEENMVVTWFTNAGNFQFTRSTDNDPNEYDPRGNTGGIIVGVYRDNRGGVTYKMLSL